MSLMRTWPVWARLLIFWITTAFFPRRPSTFVFLCVFSHKLQSCRSCKKTAAPVKHRKQKKLRHDSHSNAGCNSGSKCASCKPDRSKCRGKPFNNQKHSQDSQPDNWFHKTPLSDKRLSKSAIRHQIYFSRQIPDQLTLPSLPCSLIHQNSCSHSCIQGLHLAAHGDPDETISSFCCLFRQPVSFISNKKCCAALIILLIIGIFFFQVGCKGTDTFFAPVPLLMIPHPPHIGKAFCKQIPLLSG